MHLAPAVRFPVGRSAKAAALVALLWGAGVAALAAWAVQTAPGAAGVLAASLACAASGLLAWRSCPGCAAGFLCWDQATWTWQAEAPTPAGRTGVLAQPPRTVTELVPLIDGPRDMLLRLRTSGGVRWLWVQRDHAPGHWPDLRRALRAHPRGLADPDGPVDRAP